MDLAKDRLDVALVCDDAAVSQGLVEWGVPLEEVLPLGDAGTQHRHTLAGSVLKVNVRPVQPLTGSTPIAEVVAAVPERAEPERHEALGLTLVPPGHDGVEQLRVHLVGPDPAGTHGFWRTSLGWEDAGALTLRCGRTLIRFSDGPRVEPAEVLSTPGWSYLTVQVQDCDAEHARALARGWREARPPQTVGDVARFSLVRDPDGTVLEISERRSLTGRPLRGPARSAPQI